jgi:hypothetical protein
MNVRDTLQVISETGLTLKLASTKDTLKVYPAEKLTHELIAAIKKNKSGIIRVMREDEEMRRTGIIQSERQVFEIAYEYFGLDKPEGVA